MTQLVRTWMLLAVLGSLALAFVPWKKLDWHLSIAARPDEPPPAPAPDPNSTREILNPPGKDSGASGFDIVSWYKDHPGLAFIISLLSLIGAIARDALLSMARTLLKHLWEPLYKRFAGTPLLRRAALARYRRCLLSNHGSVMIPFRKHIPLDMQSIFVPLVLVGSLPSDRLEGSRAVRDHSRVVVLGEPGTGKTLLMKHLLLSYARTGSESFPPHTVPVLLDLARMNEEPTVTLDALLADIFTRNGFPQSEQFIHQSLKHGRLMLLLDGLDEVVSKHRQAVVREIRDTLEQYPRCRVVITCRTAVYKHEFDAHVERVFRIEEFNDLQICRFLDGWASSMAAGKSVLQLMEILRHRPRIMALARTPLLLTYIAYLYTDTAFQLPHSRAEFYDLTCRVLLEDWAQVKLEDSHYKASHKRIVLQSLALSIHTQASARISDRKTIDLPSAFACVGGILPSLNLPSSDAESLLEEVVERSGLLLLIDGGQRYQFTHLTLQEFFAASELSDKPELLLDWFERDPEGWREVLRLWCGLQVDSGRVVQDVYAIDPTTAFECVGEAQRLDSSVADEITTAFMQQFGQGTASTQVARAFAAVASDPRPRGERVFNFLKGIVERGPLQPTFMTAVDALSYTYLPQAAELFAEHYGSDPCVSRALVRMGDVAAKWLGECVDRGHVDAVGDLQEIASVNSAVELTRLVVEGDHRRAPAAAWALASLMANGEIWDGVSRSGLKVSKTQARLPSVWEPFDRYGGASHSAIAEVIAHYIAQELPPECVVVRTGTVDPRIAIPIILHDAGGSQLSQDLTEQDAADAELRQEARPQESKEATDEETVTLRWPSSRYLLANMQSGLSKELMKRLRGQPRPTLAHWRNLFYAPRLRSELLGDAYFNAAGALVAPSVLYTLYLGMASVSLAAWALIKSADTVSGALLCILYLCSTMTGWYLLCRTSGDLRSELHRMSGRGEKRQFRWLDGLTGFNVFLQSSDLGLSYLASWASGLVVCLLLMQLPLISVLEGRAKLFPLGVTMICGTCCCAAIIVMAVMKQVDRRSNPLYGILQYPDAK